MDMNELFVDLQEYFVYTLHFIFTFMFFLIPTLFGTAVMFLTDITIKHYQPKITQVILYALVPAFLLSAASPFITGFINISEYALWGVAFACGLLGDEITMYVTSFKGLIAAYNNIVRTLGRVKKGEEIEDSDIITVEELIEEMSEETTNDTSENESDDDKADTV